MQNEDVKTVVMNAVRIALKVHNNAPFSAVEASEYLRISRRKFSDIAPHIPHSIVGGKKLFLKQDLDAFIQEQRVL